MEIHMVKCADCKKEFDYLDGARLQCDSTDPGAKVFIRCSECGTKRRGPFKPDDGEVRDDA